MKRLFSCVWLFCLLSLLGLLSCGDNQSKSAELDDFLPVIPEPTGEQQSTFAGQITSENEGELIEGPAQSGRLGDFYMRNAKARFVVQAPGSSVAVVPSGGNLIDAVPLTTDGADASPDHFGETSIVYQMGRHCSHEQMNIVRDGTDGGVAVLRARGVTDYNEFVNIRGLGVLPVSNSIVPEFPDDAQCATTYILQPNSDTLETYLTIFNTREEPISGPMGMLSDTGGEVFVFLPKNGFTRLGSIAEALDGAGTSTPYVVWQGPDVAYGVIPRHEAFNIPNGSITMVGVSIFMFGVQGVLEAFNDSKNKLFSIEQNEGTTFQVDIVVGRDAASIEEKYRRLYGQNTQEISGKVLWDDGEFAEEARVGIFQDSNSNGEIDSDDIVVSYADCNDAGEYIARIEPGSYLLRAEVVAQSRSVTVSISTVEGKANMNLSLQRPISYDYRIVDDGNADALIPARITVIGEHLVPWDQRVDGDFDNLHNVVATVIAKRGTSTDVGDGADKKLLLPPGSNYRVLVSRGTEWSVAEMRLSPVENDKPEELEFRLRRVVDTHGYIASEYHVHSVGSPDSPITNEKRVATAVVDGVEFYATTDHDYVSNHQPIIEKLGLQRLVRSIPGEEISPLVYGHFNAWPIDYDERSPNGGAVEWPFGNNGLAMTPLEIFDAARSKGAELVQVNHARGGVASSSDISEHFDRMGLQFDYESHSYGSDEESMPVSTDWLRLPTDQGDLFSDQFNSLEIWNGFDATDTDLDGIREISKLDIVLRDWFNFLSFGKILTPIGSSDTHYAVLEQMGMPRTLVRVTDDSASAIESGSGLVREVLDTLTRKNGALTDVVVTDGPHIRMRVDTNMAPLGAVIDGSAESIEIQIDVQSADWAHFDTIEFFANNTPTVGDVKSSSLKPFACFTTRASLMPEDPCGAAGIGGAETLSVNQVDVGNGFMRFESSKTFTVTPANILNREGAQGSDAWIVARVRGDRAIYPLFVGNLLLGQDVSIFVNGPSAELEALLEGRGRPASAITSPIYVDFDGFGYKAPFAP